MSINIIKGSDKTIVVRLSSEDTGDPFDLSSGVSYIQACFAAAAGGAVDSSGALLPIFEEYVAPFTGDLTTGSNIIATITDTSNLRTGDPISGTGLPAGTLITGTPNDTSPTTANTVTLSANATATAMGVTLNSGNITILSPPVLGKVQILIPAVSSNLLESGPTENFEIKIIKGGITSYVQFPASLNVIERFC